MARSIYKDVLFLTSRGLAGNYCSRPKLLMMKEINGRRPVLGERDERNSDHPLGKPPALPGDAHFMGMPQLTDH
jgi:hypothetical protein